VIEWLCELRHAGDTPYLSREAALRREYSIGGCADAFIFGDERENGRAGEQENGREVISCSPVPLFSCSIV
jgi:hypothetical protein